MCLKHLVKIEDPRDLEKLRPLFQDLRFHMGTCILDGITGSAYADNPDTPRFAILLLKNFAFISGCIDATTLSQILDDLKNRTWIADDQTNRMIETIFGDRLKISQRHSFYKEADFDREKLKAYVSRLNGIYQIVEIDQSLADRINAGKFLSVTPNFSERGVGCCCMYDGEIIGIASSNIVYREGIEVNLRVDSRFQNQGIATALSAYLVLMCLDRNTPISWDAMNPTSVSVAKKLGFRYYRPYTTYRLSE